MKRALWAATGMAVVAFGVGFQVGVVQAAVEDSEQVDADANGADPVGRRRFRAPAPRCEKCPGGKKICCPDCSLYVGKACVCDCETGCACK